MADFVVSILDGVVWLIDKERIFPARMRAGVESSPVESEAVGANIDDMGTGDFVGVV